MKRNIDHEEKEESSDDTRAIIAQKKVKSEAKNPNHVKLSDAIWIFFDQKLSDHASIFDGKQLHGHFASLPVVVKLVDNTEHNKRESRILSKLNHHSNVISLIESGFYDSALESFIYIVLDRCHDDNLRRFVENRSEISLDRKLGIVRQIITGVEYIHGKGIAHLDLKPENILFTMDQQTIKIADFGLSEEISKKKVFVKFQFGTNGYRPPESFGNSYASLKSDIFSLAAVFYFILSDGKNPFGEDPDAQNYNMKNGRIDLSCLLVPNYETIKHLLQNMLELKRNKRPTISQVTEHPSWEGKDVECNFDYETTEDSESSDDEKEEDQQQPHDNLSDLPTLLALLETYSTKDKSPERAFTSVPNANAHGDRQMNAMQSHSVGTNLDGNWVVRGVRPLGPLSNVGGPSQPANPVQTQTGALRQVSDLIKQEPKPRRRRPRTGNSDQLMQLLRNNPQLMNIIVKQRMAQRQQQRLMQQQREREEERERGGERFGKP